MHRIAITCVVLFLVLDSTDAQAGPLPRSAPEAQGVNSKHLLNLVEALDSTIDGMHSVMVMRHGKVIAEGWWAPYAAEHNHVLFSLSKSFASTAVGIAVAEGKLSVDDEVLKIFPDAAPEEPSAQLKAMRVRDLLTMTTGHQEAPSAKEDVVSPKYLLAQPVPHQPGTHFKYNTAATFMLSAIVQKQTGETLADYLKPRLFEPLGIEKPVWETNFEGVALGGYGLRVRTEDIAKFGQLYLQEGEWNGRRLVDRHWISEATSRQASNGSNPDSDWEQGYGFQFWRCRHGAYRGDGAFGQYCVVLPQQDAVIAMTSGVRDMQGVLNLLWEHLLPAFHGVPLTENEQVAGNLKLKLGNLKLKSVEGKSSSPFSRFAYGKKFHFPDNDEKFEWLAVDRGQTGTLNLSMKIAGAEHSQVCGHEEWKIGGTSPDPEPTAASFGWTANDELTIKVCAFETPFVTEMKLHFSAGGKLKLERETNVAFGPRQRPELQGSTEIQN